MPSSDCLKVTEVKQEGEEDSEECQSEDPSLFDTAFNREGV